LRRDAHDALDLVSVVLADIAGGERVAGLCAEIDASSQLPHYHHIHAVEKLGADRGCAGKFGVDVHRPQVCEYTEYRAEPQQSLFGPHRRIRIGPFRPAHSTEQHRITVLAAGYRTVW
jgi:hypothetical protein